MDWSGVDYCDVFIRLSFWRHPFTAEHPLTLILTAPIHCRASIDSHSDGTHSLQSIHWLSFWRHPFTAAHPLLSKWRYATFLQIWWRHKLIYILDDLRSRTFHFSKTNKHMFKLKTKILKVMLSFFPFYGCLFGKVLVRKEWRWS